MGQCQIHVAGNGLPFKSFMLRDRGIAAWSWQSPKIIQNTIFSKSDYDYRDTICQLIYIAAGLAYN